MISDTGGFSFLECKRILISSAHHLSTHKQTISEPVEAAAANVNASISAETGILGCKIVGTSRLYDSQAIDFFGEGFWTFQISVLQAVNVTSDHLLFSEEVTSFVKAGFEIATGGATQFRSELQNFPLFGTVLSIDLRDSLSPPIPAPTSVPSNFLSHQATQTASITPSSVPSFNQTEAYSQSPSGIPNISPSASPTNTPSLMPSMDPSLMPTGQPSAFPSRGPSLRPSSAPSSKSRMGPSSQPSPQVLRSSPPSMMPTELATIKAAVNGQTKGLSRGDTVENQFKVTGNGPTQPPLVGGGGSRNNAFVIAAVAGTATLVSLAALVLCFFCRRKGILARRDDDRDRQKLFALTTRDGQTAEDIQNSIPGIVELDDEHQSLAETSLGEQTAGRHPAKSRRVSQLKTDVDSFDECSLYTTPFSLQLDDGSSFYPSRSYSSTQLSSHAMRNMDYEENILHPLSDATTDSSDGVYSFGPSSVDRGAPSADEGPVDLDTGELFRNSSLSSGRLGGPIDLDTEEPYVVDLEKGSLPELDSDERKAQKVSRALEDGNIDFDPYQIDDWSCAPEELDLGSDFGVDDLNSKSPSYSSKSTAKIGNIALMLSSGAEDVPFTHEDSWSSTEDEKREIEENVIHDESLLSTKPNKNAETPMDLMTDTQSIEVKSPSSIGSRKSMSSNKSTSSQSRGSSSAATGQPPLYPNSASRSKQLTQFDVKDGMSKNNPSSPQISSLTKLLSAKASLCTPPPPTYSIPSVTPEEEDEEADVFSIPTVTETEASHQGDATFLCETKEDGSGFLGMQPMDDVSSSSVSTEMSPSPWLFETVEQTLGPRSVNADMESLSGKSNLSAMSPSHRSKRSTPGAESVASFGSRVSFRSDLTHSNNSFAPRTFEHDLRRLEMQLANLDTDQMTTSSVTMSSIGASLSTTLSKNRPPKISKKKRIIVVVPPGKLGVILANRHDGKGTVVSEIRENSSLKGMLQQGDKLVAIDGEDVTGMLVSQITSLMAAKADYERRLTVITTVPQHRRQLFDETKSDSSNR